MAIVFLGADFHDAPLSLLEAFEAQADTVRERLCHAPESIHGSIIVATCNRAELYVESDLFHETLDYLIDLIAEVLVERPEVIGKIFRVHYGTSATRHLFAATAGLESMVIGEGEIAAQMRKAMGVAQSLGQLSAELSLLFQRSLQVAKGVWRSTELGNSGRSIIYTALTLSSATLGDVATKKALIVGTGAYARVITAALKRVGIAEIEVYSRSGRAEAFAKSHGITPVSQADLVSSVARAEVIVSASGSSGFAIHKDQVSRALEQSDASTPKVFIDVALSRDVDPEVARLDGCSVINLDMLRLHNPPEHAESIVKAESIIDQETLAFHESLHERSVEPAISALRAHIDARVVTEVEAVRRRAGDATAHEVERALRRVTNSLLHAPVVKGKELARNGRPDDYKDALELLFGLDVGQRA
jgi:glutamyl-tRNA reductase